MSQKVIRVDQEVYAALLARRHRIECETQRRSSMADAARDLVAAVKRSAK